METLYDRIKALRIGLGYSQERLALKIGYADKTSIAKIEAGKVDLPQSKIIAFALLKDTQPPKRLVFEGFCYQYVTNQTSI